MIVVDPGHEYLLRSLDGGEEIRLTFVKREGAGYPGNVGSHPGTTTQEVLRALIDRGVYVSRQIPCAETAAGIELMRGTILLFELRAARRHGRVLDLSDVAQIERAPTCEECGHVGCEGECRQ